MRWAAPLVFLLAGCGYQPVFGGTRPSAALSVAPARSVAWPRALDAALAGARSELARLGALGGEGDYPMLMVELTRVDELASGISARTWRAQGTAPAARGSTVAVTGRAWVLDERGGAPSSDTGDLRRSARHAAGPDTLREVLAHDDALNAAARELGASLARAALGVPEPE
ncbi:MAG: hypothetical protein ABW217_05225 [Polyangiaceae bacterium]